MNHAHAAQNLFGKRLLLFAVFATPLVFCTANTEAFEFPKLLLMLSTAILCAAPGLWHYRGPDGARAPWLQALPTAVLLFLLSALLSTLFSRQPLTSLLGAHESFSGLITLVGFAILFFAARAWLGAWEDGWHVALAAVAAAGLANGYALLQALRFDPLPWSDDLKLGDYQRPFGTVGNPNHLAAFLLLVMPFALVLARRAWQRNQIKTALALAVGASLAVVVIVLTISRGAWIGLLVSGGVLACAGVRGLWTIRRTWIAAALGLLAILAIVAFLGQGEMGQTLRLRVARLADGASRFEIWRGALGVWWDDPVLGSGLDTFQVAFPKHRSAAYEQIEYNTTPSRAHNEVLHVLATQGVVGVLAFLGLLAALVVTARRAWLRTPSEHRPLLLAILAGLAGYAVQGMVSFTVMSSGVLLVVLAGLLTRWSEEPTASRLRRSAPAYKPLRIVAITGAIAFFLVLVLVPLQADLACRQGEIALAAGDPKQAVAYHERAVSSQPWSAIYWLKLAYSAEADGSPVALRAFDRACALAPQDACAHLNRGLYLARLARSGQVEAREAFASLDQALALDPNNASFHADAGNVALALGDLERARWHARRGRDLAPDDAQPKAQLGYLAMSEDRFDDAVKLLEESLDGHWHKDKNAYDQARRHLGRLYVQVGNLPSVVTSRAAAALAPHLTEPSRLLSLTLTQWKK